MKSYVNLLSKEGQKDVRLEKLNSMLANFLIWVGLTLALLVIPLIVARVYLNTQLKQVETSIALQRQVVSKDENQKLKKQLNEFNSYLQNLATLDKNQALWSEALISFARLVPVGVAVDSFSADRVTRRIKVTGFAKTRDEILLLRNNLLASEYFKNVNFPLSNLVKATDAEFRYTFYVDEKALLTK